VLFALSDHLPEEEVGEFMQALLDAERTEHYIQQTFGEKFSVLAFTA